MIANLFLSTDKQPQKDGQPTMGNKMKTHKGTKKRFRISANGKIKHRAAGKSHRNVRMSSKRTRDLRGVAIADDGAMTKTIVKSLGKYSY